MHCIILAAGFSTRMYPLTKNFPKALLPIKGKAIVDHVYEDIREQKEITGTTVITNDCFYNLFSRHFSRKYPDDTITVINNKVTSVENRQGAIGDLVYVIQEQNLRDDLLVIASDTLTSLKMQDFIRFYRQFKGIATVVFDGQDTEKIKGKLGCVTVERGKITQFIEKPEHPTSTLMAVPYYIFPKASLPFLSTFLATNHGDAPGTFIAWVLPQFPTYAYTMGTGYYHDIGTVSAYEALRAKI